MKILGIESSCDETAAAIVENGKTVLASVVASSTKMYQKYGGIVPEVASREQVKIIIPVLKETIQTASPAGKQYGNLTINDIDAIAVTVGPGLIGSLLVGVETAKTLAFALNKPIIPVNHVIAHMYANFVSNQQSAISDQKAIKNHEPRTMNHEPITFPAISLVVSGGHTELYLMKNEQELAWLGGTLDDAAGEAFDKGARLLGFENRGGPAIAEAAMHHEPRTTNHELKLPRPMMHDDSLSFSFSGLKAALLREVTHLKQAQQFNTLTVQQLAYELQEAITDVLVAKTLRAALRHQTKSILISGGVSANLRLREKFRSTIQPLNHLTFHSPALPFCTDNAATIATCAYYQNKPVDWHHITATPDLSVEV